MLIPNVVDGLQEDFYYKIMLIAFDLDENYIIFYFLFYCRTNEPETVFINGFHYTFIPDC